MKTRSTALPRVALAWLLLTLSFGFSGCVCLIKIPVAPFSGLDAEPPGLQPDGGAPTDEPTLASCLRFEPQNLDFGASQLRCDAPKLKKVEVFHTGDAHCPGSITITSIGLAQATGSNFSIRSAPNTPFPLRIGETLLIELSYYTKTLSKDRNQLLVAAKEPQPEVLKIPLEGIGEDQMSRRDTYLQLFRPTDILFVVDNSRSMAQEQTTLTQNFSSFLQWAQRLHSDFHIGFLPLQVEESKLGCLHGNPTVLTSKTKDIAAAFARNVSSAVRIRSPESGLEMAYRALSEPRRSGCNKGFLRPDAILSMIFISDERDQSSEEYDFYLKFFRSLKPKEQQHMLRASAVVGPTPNGCSSSFGRADAGPRYLQLAKDLGGLSASICERDWVQTLQQIGRNSVLGRVTFPLKREPIESSIVVRVDGKQLPKSEKDGWSYEATGNQIRFSESTTPIPGQKIDIDYLIQCPPKTP